MATKVFTGFNFGKAFCKHFNLDANMVSDNMVINCGSNSILSATVNICLTAEDIVAIGEIMKGESK